MKILINTLRKDILTTVGDRLTGLKSYRQIVRFEPKKFIVLDIYDNNAYDLQMELNYE